MAAPLLEKLSESLGSPEPAVRLILSILIGEFGLMSDLRVSVTAAEITPIQRTGSSALFCSV